LMEVIRLARGVPDTSPQLATMLLELAEMRDLTVASEKAPPSSAEDPIFNEALRVAERMGEFAGIALLAQARLRAKGPDARVRVMLVRALRRQGDLAGAAQAARAFADESAPRWTSSVAWMTAAAANDEPTRGYALAAVAPGCGHHVRATISAAAAEALAASG